MSGGAFDYAYYHPMWFADKLKTIIDSPDIIDEWGNTLHKYEPATLLKFKEIEALARRTSDLMREVEWLCSGDTTEDTFMNYIKVIETSNYDLNEKK